VKKPLLACVAVAVASCATTPAAGPVDESVSQSEAAPVASEASPSPALEASPSTAPESPPAASENAGSPASAAIAAPAGTPTPERKAGDRTDDGIDDETWLPRADTPAFQAFTAAVATSHGDPNRAIEAFVDAAKKSAGFYAAWFNAGAAAELAGRPADAERYYRQALTVRADYGPALSNLAELLARSGKAGEATALLDDAVRRFPEKAGPFSAVAVRALAKGDLPGAETAARTAMKFDERNVAAMAVMAQVFHAQGRLDTARFAVDNALDLEPGNALLHLERGRVLLALNEKKEALIAFERAARLRPSLAEAQEAYGLELLAQGFPVEAEAAFARLVQLEPRSATAQLHLGNALRTNKKYAPAETAYRRALEIDGNLVEAHFNLGILFVDNGVGPADELARLQLAVDELKKFRDSSSADAASRKRVDEYVDATEKRIAKERKRREREEKRKAADAAAAPTSAPASPATETPPGVTPPDGKPATEQGAGAAPATDGGRDDK
jgi:tetratricopeptide (TPR) repeat protein